VFDTRPTVAFPPVLPSTAQVTLVLFVPPILAVKGWVLETVTVAEVGLTAIVTVGLGGSGGKAVLFIPAQAVITIISQIVAAN
jgi:hypothetical protein